MKEIFQHLRLRKIGKRMFLGLVFAGASLFLHQGATAQVLIVDLGTATSFAVLGGSGITNAGLTVITGDVGSSPTATTAGFGTVILNGTNHGGDAVTVQAKADLATAYADIVGRTPTTIYGAIFDLGGEILTTGVYNNPSSFGITGILTLDAQGDPNAVWIFQAGSTLITTAGNSTVLLIGGAQASNVFWQVGSSATLGANTVFAGSILADVSISVDTGTTVDGRLLAQNGAVTLVSDIIDVPEPSSLLLLGFGLAALFVFRRRFFGLVS
jgi:hypothetical protein